MLAFRCQLVGLLYADESSFIGDSPYSAVLLLGATKVGETHSRCPVTSTRGCSVPKCAIHSSQGLKLLLILVTVDQSRAVQPLASVGVCFGSCQLILEVRVCDQLIHHYLNLHLLRRVDP
jgi:hypothetical protein